MALRTCAGLSLTFVLLIHSADGKAAPKKKDKPKGGSAKCEKGVFDSLVKDATIPLCDAHYPDEKASKNDWLILFYNKHEDDKYHRDPMNRVAIDLGNEPPERSKAQKLPLKKQRQRIKDLAEKWNFQPNIPKKGLEDKGKDALLKVGAVCCDCAGEQEVCKKGLGLRLVRVGKPDILEEHESHPLQVEKVDTEKTIHFAMSNMGFMKDVEAQGTTASAASKAASESAGTETKEALGEKLEKLKEQKKQAAADEEYEKAAQLKDEIKKVEEQIKTAPSAADAASPDALQKKLDDLMAQKKKAVAAEDYKKASDLKKDIAALEEQIKSVPRGDNTAALTGELDDLHAQKKQAIADEDYKKASQLKKEIQALEAKLGKTEL